MYVIRNREHPDCMISGVGIGSCAVWPMRTVAWTISASCAIHFEYQQAKDTITFIRAVLDPELADLLHIEEAPNENPVV